MKKIIIIFLSVLILTFFTGCINTGINSNETTAPDSTAFLDSQQTETDTDTIDFDQADVETLYEYMDFEGWEYPDNISAEKYFSSTNLLFEENDTVSVDKLMGYYTLFEMRDNDTGELLDDLIPYRTHPNGETIYEKYEISIPKELVNTAIENHFAVKIDGKNSKYTDPENDQNYLLYPSASGGLIVSMKDYVTDGNRSTAVYAPFDSIDKKIHRIVEICIENEDSEENFRIIYAREID